jgi:hypothetical protein
MTDRLLGAHLVDTFPILDNLPNFLAPWRAEANRKHDQEMDVSDRADRIITVQPY